MRHIQDGTWGFVDPHPDLQLNTYEYFTEFGFLFHRGLF